MSAGAALSEVLEAVLAPAGNRCGWCAFGCIPSVVRKPSQGFPEESKPMTVTTRAARRMIGSEKTSRYTKPGRMRIGSLGDVMEVLLRCREGEEKGGGEPGSILLLGVLVW